MRGRAYALAAFIMLAASPSYAAKDCEAPCFGYGISTELEGDWIYESTPSSFGGSDLEPTVDKSFYFKPVDHLKFFSAVTTESVTDRPPGGERAFEDVGTYVEKLFVVVDYQTALVRLGKIEPNFGLATHKLDGIYATDLLGDYDNKERWGAEVVLDFEALGLSQSIGASAFTVDRTVLSESLFTNRGRTTLSDGGAGNSEGSSSFIVFLDGCKDKKGPDCYADGRFGYRLSFRHQDAGRATEEQIDENITPGEETGYLATATARFNIAPVTLRLLDEFAYFEHFDDGPDDAWYATASASAEIEPVTFMATYTHKRNLIAGEPDTNEDLVDLTGAYEFGEEDTFPGKWTLAAAYGYSRDADGHSDHAIGLKLTVDLEGTSGHSTRESEDE
jgi:hypothetical protein